MIFLEAKNRVDQACADKNPLSLKLEELGFMKEDLTIGQTGGRLFHDLYTFSDDAENTVEVEYWCYDQSKPFQILPDMNKFVVRHFRSGELAGSYANSYED